MVASANISIGNNVKVNVKINNNPDIASYTLRLNFDRTKLVPALIESEICNQNLEDVSPVLQ